MLNPPPTIYFDCKICGHQHAFTPPSESNCLGRIPSVTKAGVSYPCTCKAQPPLSVAKPNLLQRLADRIKNWNPFN